MTTYIELAGRVLRCEMLPDGPGVMLRSITVTVESGPPLRMTRAEADAMVGRIAVEMMGDGVDVHGWGYTPDQSDD